MMNNDDNGGQMIFGDLGGLKLPDISLTGEVKPRKITSPRKIVPTGDRTRALCVKARMLPPVPQRWTSALVTDKVNLEETNTVWAKALTKDRGMNCNGRKSRGAPPVTSVINGRQG